MGAKKKIAAVEEGGRSVPVLMVFFVHSFNDSRYLRVEGVRRES